MANPHDGHRKRLRARYMREGIDSFAPHEVLELAMYITIPRGDTNQIAHALLERFGSLAGVFEASVEELCKVEGVGPKTAELLSLTPSLTRCYYVDKNDVGKVLKAPDEWGEYLCHRFIGYHDELLYLLCLDKKGKVLHGGVLTRGTHDAVRLDVRAVMEMVTQKKAAAVVLAHNHPGGLAFPSSDDINSTLALRGYLKPVGVELLDHIVVAGEDYISMRASGTL